MTFRVLADEHVKRVFVKELRANGFDVAWIDGGYDVGTADVEHMERSADAGRVIVSNDADFARLYESHDHAGVILYDEQNVPVTAFVRGVKRIERFVPPTELRGRLL